MGAEMGEAVGIEAGGAVRGSRRLDSQSGSTCRRVAVKYDCNCRCAVRVFSKQCSVQCMPYWRSFIPVRVTVQSPEPGFYATPAHTMSLRARTDAVGSFQQMLTTNATTAYNHQKLNVSDSKSHLQNFDDVSTYSLPEYSASAPFEPLAEGFSRVVTSVYDHHGSRRAAIANLDRPEFYPSVTTPCFYEPRWDPHAPFVTSAELAFASEMGFRLWKWLILGLTLTLCVVCFLLILQPNLLGGEEVVEAVTVIDGGSQSVRHNFFGLSMW